MHFESALAARLAGRPLAIAPRRLDAVLRARLDPAPMVSPRDGIDDYAKTETGIAVVPVIGPLVARGDWITDLLGAMSYGNLTASIASAFEDPSAQAVMLEIDTLGGEVGDLSDLVGGSSPAIDQVVWLRNQG